MSTILIVDDEYSIRRTLGMLLKSHGHRALEAASVEEAVKLLDSEPLDLLITDMRLGPDNGMQLLSEMSARGNAESIVMTAYGSIENAVDAMRLGAYDYLTKPINPDELLLRVNKVLEKKSLREEVDRLRQQLSGRNAVRGIVAESPAMKQILQLLERIRTQDIPVLITGETGVGKEVIARAVHAMSHRAKGPFVAINCATLPEELLDSELFGHVKGAFTGASQSRPGLFREADGGTLFLDEIGDVSPRLQAKLLRVLQEGEVRPVGGGALFHVDVRVVAATNRDLERLSRMGEFRNDLLFRLNVLPVVLPPLRERREDIPALIDHFLAGLRERRSMPDLNLTATARRKLILYDWPGNVRQLENVLERSFALYPGPLLDAMEVVINPGAGGDNALDDPGELPLAEVEARHIRQVLAAQHGNQVAAARILGISRSTLRRKLQEMGALPASAPGPSRELG
ncbi:MAG TPA: sigma-54 dependent transcriptional regulator [Gammaproteobacteria bacterium]|nr:sigma-54 dependent transcriptional regulator [Gammaproteobacteria bacterium]